jgi:hypothetical protein
MVDVRGTGDTIDAMGALEARCQNVHFHSALNAAGIVVFDNDSPTDRTVTVDKKIEQGSAISFYIRTIDVAEYEEDFIETATIKGEFTGPLINDPLELNFTI